MDTLNQDKLTFFHSTQGIFRINYFFPKPFLIRQIKIGHIKPRHIEVNILANKNFSENNFLSDKLK